MSRKSSRLLVSLLVLAILLTGCSLPIGQQPTKTLVVAIDNDEGLLTPYNWNTWVGGVFIGYIYSNLFSRDPQLEWVPDLATDAAVSPDNLTWTVNLRKEVKWHDGEAFTADDVVFTHNFNLARTAKRGGKSNLLSVGETGDYQVVFKLEKPDPYFYFNFMETYIVPEHLWKDVEVLETRLPNQIFVGTGPFKLVEEKPGEFYRLKRYDGYFGKKAQVEEILAQVIKDRTVQFQALKANQVQAVLVSIPSTLVSELQNQTGIKLSSGSDFFNYSIFFNHDKAPFNDAKFRKAVAQAVDRQKLVDVVMLGYATLLTPGYYHPALPWTRKDLKLEYSPTEAKKILDDGGYKDSNGDGVREYGGKPMEFSLIADANNPTEVRCAELIQQMLKDVGIKINVRTLDIDTGASFVWPKFQAKNGRDYDMTLWAWSAGPMNQTRFASFMMHGDLVNRGWANISGINVPEMNDLLDKLDASLDAKSQNAILQDVQAKFAELMLWVPLFSPNGNFAYRSAAYDKWLYMEGIGIHNRWSFSPR